MSNPLPLLATFLPALVGAAPANPISDQVSRALLASRAPVHAPCDGVRGLDLTRGSEPREGERLEYELRFGGAYMGKLELSVGNLRQVDGASAVPLLGRIRTNAFVSAVKPVEGRYMAMVDPSTLTPLGVRVEGKVGDDQRWEKVRFSPDGRRVETHFLYRGREQRKTFGGEHEMLEGLSLLHIARRVPLQPGLVACQDILSTRRVWRVRAEVLGTETVQTPVGPQTAYRVRTLFERRTRSKRRPTPIGIDVLLGDLPGRPPLAFEMTQKRFSGRANLIRWSPGRKG